MNRRRFLETGIYWGGLATISAGLPALARGSERELQQRYATSPAKGPLKVSTVNPRYFADSGGNIVYLTGSHTWSDGMEDRGTLDPPPAFDFTRFINFLITHNHNWFRLWTAEMANVEAGGDDQYENIAGPPFKWERTGPGKANDGKPKFDFTRLDQAYFDRMRSRVIQAGQSGLYVSVMIFNGYEWQFEPGPIDGNPFNPENNVNSVNCPGTGPSDTSVMSSAVWKIEQAYIHKVIDTVNDLDNVMYEVSNESGAYSTEWQARVIDEIHRYEAGKPKQHPVGMTFQWKGGADSTLYSSEAEWVSPHATYPGDQRGRKVIINDTDHSYSWPAMRSDGRAAQQAWVWKNLTSGNNLAFMDPYVDAWRHRNEPIGRVSDPYIGAAVDPYWEVLRNSMGRARTYADKIDLLNMTPQAELSTTGFCLAHVGRQYLIYLPASRNEFALNLIEGDYAVEWYDPTQGMIAQKTSVTVPRGRQGFAPPSCIAADAVLWLHK